jgi:hypothetical protein
MPKLFIVERQERWTQIVYVEAETSQEALDKAYDGGGDINDDAEFVEFIHKENATVEEHVPEKPYVDAATATGMYDHDDTN